MKFTFKSFISPKGQAADDHSPEEDPQSRHQKRREQVRRAQKTHRERKEAYIKSLESEVISLRASEARLMQETKSLYLEMSMIKNLLVEHNIPLRNTLPTAPAYINVDKTSKEAFELSIRQTSPSNRKQRIYVQKPDVEQGLNFNDPLSNFASDLGNIPPLDEGTAHQQVEVPVNQFDHNVIGMDFILCLEGPCLTHIPTSQDHDHSPQSSGHALMASATLLHQRPATPPGTSSKSSSPTWHVHESSIERLLELSTTIPLDEEITPVQAWDQLRKHPQFSTLEYSRLERLKSELVTHVKCYGFGGVISQDVFENALFNAFVVGRVF